LSFTFCMSNMLHILLVVLRMRKLMGFKVGL